MIKPKEKDIKLLNKQLNWKIKYTKYCIRFIQLECTSPKLVVFTNVVFANNLNLISQIEYIIYLAD